ncbi:DnaJ domain-containing protein [Lasiosphaeria miniovina]|uniref:DnaJ domain-containing protein n=1 Tax=Lasiosphaeria miniovina TaxID=1954250 RepID=A0AA39ZQB3_9PEZI|nr:DnaJ domain-containing protein [Lasiosphaeria miniovina]KAK0701710.1 DnaJ domain-containing protein [Lasiosphaeria miniovina]
MRETKMRRSMMNLALGLAGTKIMVRTDRVRRKDCIASSWCPPWSTWTKEPVPGAVLLSLLTRSTEEPQQEPRQDKNKRKKKQKTRVPERAAPDSDHLPFYKLLEVLPTASFADIAKAYKRLSLICHPDKPIGSTKAFQQLGQAYSVLIDNDLRALYNMVSPKI